MGSRSSSSVLIEDQADGREALGRQVEFGHRKLRRRCNPPAISAVAERLLTPPVALMRPLGQLAALPRTALTYAKERLSSIVVGFF